MNFRYFGCSIYYHTGRGRVDQVRSANVMDIEQIIFIWSRVSDLGHMHIFGDIVVVFQLIALVVFDKAIVVFKNKVSLGRFQSELGKLNFLLCFILSCKVVQMNLDFFRHR